MSGVRLPLLLVCFEGATAHSCTTCIEGATALIVFEDAAALFAFEGAAALLGF